MRRALCIYVTVRSLNCWQSYDLLPGMLFSVSLAGSCIVADIFFTFALNALNMKLPSLSVGHDTLFGFILMRLLLLTATEVESTVIF